MPISENVVLGKGVNIYHPDLVNLYGCEIGNGTKIGAFVEIQKNVRVGANVKIQAFAFIPEGVTIGDGVFIGPHVAFTNDMRPRSLGEWKLEKTLVKRGASIGTNSTIVCGVTLGEDCMIGAGSVVTRDIPANGLAYGNPAKLRGFICRCKGNAEKTGKKGGSVILRCRECGQEFPVKGSDYKKTGRG